MQIVDRFSAEIEPKKNVQFSYRLSTESEPLKAMHLGV
jgi:hypothetical protein